MTKRKVDNPKSVYRSLSVYENDIEKARVCSDLKGMHICDFISDILNDHISKDQDLKNLKFNRSR